VSGGGATATTDRESRMAAPGVEVALGIGLATAVIVPRQWRGGGGQADGRAVSDYTLLHRAAPQNYTRYTVLHYTR
jgi:hypothetical protein